MEKFYLTLTSTHFTIDYMCKYQYIRNIRDFTFVKGYHPLDQLIEFALKYVDSDPNSSIIKQGMILEYIIKNLLYINHFYNPKDAGEYLPLNNLITIAKKNNLLPKNQRVRDDIYNLKTSRNDAVHEFKGNPHDAKQHIDFICSFSKWFIENFACHKHSDYNGFCVEESSVPYRAYGDYEYENLLVENIKLPLAKNETVLDYTRRKLAELQ